LVLLGFDGVGWFNFQPACTAEHRTKSDAVGRLGERDGAVDQVMRTRSRTMVTFSAWANLDGSMVPVRREFQTGGAAAGAGEVCASMGER
jgi:hypothetical protein